MPEVLLNLVVLRAQDPERLAEFYRGMGLCFQPEQHGSGPRHMSCEIGGAVIEIYPAATSGETTKGTRIGFAVPDLEAAWTAARGGEAIVLSEPRSSAWGRRAVFRDPEGHTVELLERSGSAQAH